MKLAKIFKGKSKDKDPKAEPPKVVAAPTPTPTPVVVKLAPSTPSPAPAKQNTGYSPDLDLEGRVFKGLIAQGGKDELTTSFLAHQVYIDEKSSKRYGFFERGVSLPVYLLIATQNVYVVDSTSFEIQKKIPLLDIKEVAIEVSDNGLFCIEAKDGAGSDITKHFFVASPVPALLSGVLVAFQHSAKQSGDKFIVSQRAIFQHNYIERFNRRALTTGLRGAPVQYPLFGLSNRRVVASISDDLDANGFTEKDIWEGSVDLRPWIKKYKDEIQPSDKDQTFVVEFNIVSTGEKVYYKPSEHVLLAKVLEALSSKASQPPAKLALAPINGCEMDGSATFGSYGLGLLFDSWQLNVIVKDYVKIIVTVTIPESIVALEKATVSSVTYKCLNIGKTKTKDFVALICKQTGVSNPHRFTLMHTKDDYGGVFEDNYPLSAHGINKSHSNLKLLYKKFPLATGDVEKDTEVVADGISLLLQAVEKSIKQKKKQRMESYLRRLVYSLADTAVEELEKAQPLKARYVCLSDTRKKAVLKLLEDLEAEEVATYNIPSQRRLKEHARDFIWNNIPPAPPATLPPAKPPPPPVPPKPSSNKQRTIQLRGGVTLPGEDGAGSNGEPRLRATIEIGGTWSGPPGTNDILAARQRLRSVETTRFSGWDKSAENLRLGPLINTKDAKKSGPNDMPQEALELFLKLKKRHQMIEAASSSEDAEDLGD